MITPVSVTNAHLLENRIVMKHLAIASFIIVGLSSAFAARADEKPVSPAAELCPQGAKTDGQQSGEPVPTVKAAITRHRLTAGGVDFAYTAKVGAILIRDDHGKPMANIGYFAYTRDVPDRDRSRRPVIFAFNGGPGASSLMLHMGMLGPRRVVIADPDAATPPAPYASVANAFSVLDKSDVVLIDPVGTGISHPVCDRTIEDFTSVDKDADSVSRFVAQYLGDNDRWTSPKYLFGESYGTIRASAVANDMLANRAVSFDGLILLGLATDLQILASGSRSNERPYAKFLPGFAAVAWYHGTMPNRPPALEPFLDEVRAYAAGPYNAALFKGDRISDAERDAVAEQIHRYTSLSTDFIKSANLRVSEFAFGNELLKSRRQTVSRLDGRFVGLTLDPLQRGAAYDPAFSAIQSNYTAVLQDYLKRDLKLDTTRSYQTWNNAVSHNFDLRHKPVGGLYGGGGRTQSLVNAGDDLARVLVEAPETRVLVLAGYYDLGSPFAAAEYMVSHLGVPKAASERIEIKYYESGHMIYVHQPSLEKLKRDIDAFLEAKR